MMEYFELFLRGILGIQLTFWGLNGFFYWKQVPPAPPMIEKFVGACIESRFIMPVVKVFEILFGFFLIVNFAVPLALVMLAPILFVITALHLSYNKRAWEVVLPLSLPFAMLLAFHYKAWLTLLH